MCEEVKAPEEVVAEPAAPVGEAVAEPVVAAEAVAEKVESMEDFKDELEASLKQGPPRDDDPVWDKFEQQMADKTVFTVTVDSVVKGGVVAFVDEIRAFIPASKLASGYVENLEEYKGKDVDVMVITADRAAKKLVLSGREVARQKNRAAKAAAQAACEVGAVLEGTVDSLKDYGAFINLEGGMTGLLHVSEISYKRVEKPADVLKEGEKVQVKVKDNKNGKISLSMKMLQEPPKREPRPERKEGDRPERKERGERRPRKEETIEYTEAGTASTSLKDLLSGLKLD